MDNNKISIIIPSRQLMRDKNLKHFYRPVTSLPDLVKSIEEHVNIPHEIIVVVNGMQDKKLLEFVQSGRVHKYAINSCNAGVSRAWNMGRQLAEGDYLLYVNDDVVFGADSVRPMIKALDCENVVAMVGPKGAEWKNGEHVRFVGEHEPAYADAIAGFCFLMRASAFDQAGGFDIAYSPAGMEEIDMCYALRKLGHQLKVIPHLAIHTEPRHGISARRETIKYLSTQVDTEQLQLRNKAYFMAKWGAQA